AIGARAIARPRPEMVARLGPRPTGGDHRRTWEAALRATAAYQARWEAEAGQPGYGTQAGWAIGPRPDNERSPWAEQRTRAERIVTRWTTTLDSAQHKRFWQPIERIPRERATAGIHALLAAGVPADDICAALTAREEQSARSPSAILDHRVKELLSACGVDPAGHRLPPPKTSGGEWDRIAGLLVAAEANQLSRRPVSALAAERRELAQLLIGVAPADAADRLAGDVAAARAALDQVS